MKTGSLWFFLRVLFANAALASILLYLQGDAADWLAKTAFMRLRDLLLLVGIGGMSYIAVLLALGLRWRQLQPG